MLPSIRVFSALAFVALSFTGALSAETLPPLTGGAPQTVQAMWAGFDPRAEPLDVEVLKEWEIDGVTLQIVRYRVGIFNGEKAIMAGVYGYPTGQTNLPALVQIHGGGQFAHTDIPIANAKRGYATLSISREGRIAAPDYFVNNDILRNVVWAGKTDHPQYRLTTDWAWLNGGGRYEGGGTGVEPAACTIDDVPSPRNSNWFLWAMAARRGLTFLEQRPEVDPDRLGVYGHSMGGKTTVLAVAADDRVKVAAPSCGGVSNRNTGKTLYDATIGDDKSLAAISCPIFFLKPSNDFHAAIEDVVLALEEIQTKDWRVHHSPHKNHQDAGEYEVATQIWLDQHLKDGMVLPASPKLSHGVNAQGVPTVTVSVDTSRAVQAVEVYYTQMGEDAGEKQPWQDQPFRHWHDAAAQGAGDTWTAETPILSTNEPLWVYANVTYALDAPISSVGYYNQPFTTDQFVLSTPLAMLTSAQLQAANAVGTLSATDLIDDFQGDWKKAWFDYTRDPDDWAITTHKINDPVCQRPKLAKLVLEVRSVEANTLLVAVNDTAKASVELPGGEAWQTIELLPMQFAVDGKPWANDFSGAKRLRLSSGSSPKWQGPAPEFRNLRWASATQEAYDAFAPVGEYVQRNTAPDVWGDWANEMGWYSESKAVRAPAAEDWVRIHYNRHTFVTDDRTVAKLDMFMNGGAALRIDKGGSVTVAAAGGFDGSIHLSGAGAFAKNPNVGSISVEHGGRLVSANTGTRTVLSGDASQPGSLTLNGGTFTAQGRSPKDKLFLSDVAIHLNSGTFDVTGGMAIPRGVVFDINGEGTDIRFWLLNHHRVASEYRFALGANGVSPVNVTGWAHLAQARLHVDGTNYTGGAQDITLFATPHLSSTIDPANIQLVNFPAWAAVTVVQDDVTTHDVVLRISGTPK